MSWARLTILSVMGPGSADTSSTLSMSKAMSLFKGMGSSDTICSDVERALSRLPPAPSGTGRPPGSASRAPCPSSAPAGSRSPTRARSGSPRPYRRYGRRVGLEARLDGVQHVLQHSERDLDAPRLPHVLLVAHRPVRTAADDVAPLLGAFHHVPGDWAGAVARRQSAVYVEADEPTGRRPAAPSEPSSLDVAGIRCSKQCPPVDVGVGVRPQPGRRSVIGRQPGRSKLDLWVHAQEDVAVASGRDLAHGGGIATYGHLASARGAAELLDAVRVHGRSRAAAAQVAAAGVKGCGPSSNVAGVEVERLAALDAVPLEGFQVALREQSEAS